MNLLFCFIFCLSYTFGVIKMLQLSTSAFSLLTFDRLTLKIHSGFRKRWEKLLVTFLNLLIIIHVFILKLLEYHTTQHSILLSYFGYKYNIVYIVISNYILLLYANFFTYIKINIFKQF